MFLGILLMICGGGASVVGYLGRVKGVPPHLRALAAGNVAEGPVEKIVIEMVGARAESEDRPAQAGTPVQRLLIGFTDAGGTRVTYKERDKPAENVQVGAYYPVHYDPADPAGSATILPAHHYERQRRNNTKVLAGTLAVFVLGLLIVIGVVPV